MNDASKKAKELVENYMKYSQDEQITDSSTKMGHLIRLKNAKSCALICVDEIIDQLESVKEFVSDSYLYSIHKAIEYQEKVKEQINIL